MAELVKPDTRVFDDSGVRVTMPFIVRVTTEWLVEARNREQAVAAIQRGTSYSSIIIPAQLGFTAEAGMATPEMMAEFAKLRSEK